MTVSELLDLFRKETDDISEPYLWSDDEFFAYLNDAQNVFVSLIGGIADRRSSITKVSYKTGDQFKRFDERIMRVRMAQDESNNKVTVKNIDNFETEYLEDDYGLRINAGLDDGRTGDIQFLITDAENEEYQLYPIPDHDGWLRLHTYRRPLDEITGTNSELEIPSHQRFWLLEWVKYRAYMKQDVETFDKAKAEDYKASFTEYTILASREKSGRHDRKRTVRYGGIPM